MSAHVDSLDFDDEDEAGLPAVVERGCQSGDGDPPRREISILQNVVDAATAVRGLFLRSLVLKMSSVKYHTCEMLAIFLTQMSAMSYAGSKGSATPSMDFPSTPCLIFDSPFPIFSVAIPMSDLDL